MPLPGYIDPIQNPVFHRIKVKYSTDLFMRHPPCATEGGCHKKHDILVHAFFIYTDFCVEMLYYYNSFWRARTISYSVIMPTRRESSITGRPPTPFASINRATSPTFAEGVVV